MICHKTQTINQPLWTFCVNENTTTWHGVISIYLLKQFQCLWWNLFFFFFNWTKNFTIICCSVFTITAHRWTIGRSGERGSGISVLPARYDDDDDDYNTVRLFLHLQQHTQSRYISDKPSTHIRTHIPPPIYIYIPNRSVEIFLGFTFPDHQGRANYTLLIKKFFRAII